jgi:hypothetical protein
VFLRFFWHSGAFRISRGRLPNGSGFLVFEMLLRTCSPLKRLDLIIPGVRSMSLSRYAPGAFLQRRWPRGYEPLPVD